VAATPPHSRSARPGFRDAPQRRQHLQRPRSRQRPRTGGSGGGYEELGSSDDGAAGAAAAYDVELGGEASAAPASRRSPSRSKRGRWAEAEGLLPPPDEPSLAGWSPVHPNHHGGSGGDGADDGDGTDDEWAADQEEEGEAAAAAAPSERPVEVRVVIHEARELRDMDGGAGNDAYVLATCFGQRRRTRIAPKGLSPIWEEELQFEGTVGGLSQGMLQLEVWDHDKLFDDSIGTFTFSLDDVRGRPDKEYYKAWVSLFRSVASDEADECGQQGQLLVSVTVLEEGDELPPRPKLPMEQEGEGGGDSVECELTVVVYRAEGCPRMDRSGSADPYISVSWEGSKTRTEAPRGTLTPEWYQVLRLPVLREQSERAPPRTDMVYVRLREHNQSLFNGLTNNDTAYGLLYLSDVAEGQWTQPTHLNLYGAPRLLDDADLQMPAELDTKLLDAMNRAQVAGSAYRGRLLLAATLREGAPPPRGEAELQRADAEALGADMAGRAVGEALSRAERAELKEATRLPGGERVRWRCRPPSLDLGGIMRPLHDGCMLYTLRVALLCGSDLPSSPALALRLSWGLPPELLSSSSSRGATASAPPHGSKSGHGAAAWFSPRDARIRGSPAVAGRGGGSSSPSSPPRSGSGLSAGGVLGSGAHVEWRELRVLEQVCWPSDLSQVPDVLLELVDTAAGGGAERRRTHLVRLSAAAIGGVGRMVTQQRPNHRPKYGGSSRRGGGGGGAANLRLRASWVDLDRCRVGADEDGGEPAQPSRGFVEPQLLLALGMDRVPLTGRVGGDDGGGLDAAAWSSRPIKTPHVAYRPPRYHGASVSALARAQGLGAEGAAAGSHQDFLTLLQHAKHIRRRRRRQQQQRGARTAAASTVEPISIPRAISALPALVQSVPMTTLYELRVCVYQARGLCCLPAEVAGTGAGAQPPVPISAAAHKCVELQVAGRRARSRSAAGAVPEWYQCLALSGLALPGRGARDAALAEAPPLLLSVLSQQSASSSSQPFQPARLRLPLAMLAAGRGAGRAAARPLWLPLCLPGQPALVRRASKFSFLLCIHAM
jgi:hypothetical protein